MSYLALSWTWSWRIASLRITDRIWARSLSVSCCSSFSGNKWPPLPCKSYQVLLTSNFCIWHLITDYAGHFILLSLQKPRALHSVSQLSSSSKLKYSVFYGVLCWDSVTDPLCSKRDGKACALLTSVQPIKLRHWLSNLSWEFKERALPGEQLDGARLTEKSSDSWVLSFQKQLNLNRKLKVKIEFRIRG